MLEGIQTNLKVIEARQKDWDWKAKGSKGRIYFFPKGENVWENLENRHHRPYKEYRKLIPEALEKVGYTKEEISKMKFVWSQKAGCSCPCSPGFIVTNGVHRKDVYVYVDVSF